jgi:phenylacetate-CoA ligase
VIATAAFTPAEEDRLIGLLRDRAGEGMAITIRRETDIPREASGKYRWVISHVPAPRFRRSDGEVE